ncbi:MAG: glycosyl transferase family 2 [Patescibacteria group bacterium]|nr:MAG: glycosyl transferase family 2 [Patescibacteria group bacterium]
MKEKKVVVVLPAYNAEKTLEKTVSEIPKDYVDEIILVDDGSLDNTYKIAKKLKLTAYKHKTNKGYGANQKTCYKLALAHNADIIIMLHPDYQYDPKVIKYFVEIIQDGYFDIMLGTRIRSRQEAIQSGMPIYKYFANRILTFIENILSGQNLSEWHTGYRAFRKKVLQTIPFEKNSDDFVFDTQILFQAVERGFRIGELSIPARYLPESSSINFKRSIIYAVLTLKTAVLYFLRSLVTQNKYEPKTK